MYQISTFIFIDYILTSNIRKMRFYENLERLPNFGNSYKLYPLFCLRETFFSFFFPLLLVKWDRKKINRDIDKGNDDRFHFLVETYCCKNNNKN